MPNYSNPLLIDNGLSHMKARGQRVAILRNYAFGDNYATVTGNIVSDAATTPADFTLGDYGTGRRVTSTAKSGSAAAVTTTAGDDLHVAVLDDENTAVVYVCDEISNQIITAGNPTTIPEVEYRIGQPVAP